ncbi:Ribonuclease H domain [Dillenia turbinata]|uniref:Ribonuclease H domain n=1 Tax=Dillenia turbinata TaxID=194707 RepID=A0AAN8V5F8_9MAGN
MEEESILHCLGDCCWAREIWERVLPLHSITPEFWSSTRLHWLKIDIHGSETKERTGCVQVNPVWVKWEPPNAYNLKLNTDGFVALSSKQVTAGGILGDKEELWGVREELLMIKNKNLRNIEVEVDSSAVVEALTKGVPPPLSLIIDECSHLMHRVNVLPVNNIYREANVCGSFGVVGP